jgi:hypothetical protein
MRLHDMTPRINAFMTSHLAKEKTGYNILWQLGCKILTIVQDKQKETCTVDLVLVVEEKHIIECPTLVLWLLMGKACGVKCFVFTHQNPHVRPQTSDHCPPRQTKGNMYGGFSPGS